MKAQTPDVVIMSDHVFVLFFVAEGGVSIFSERLPRWVSIA